jgi:hypothetical protein
LFWSSTIHQEGLLSPNIPYCLSAQAGEPKTKKTSLARKESSSLLSQKNKQKEEPYLEVTVLPKDSPLEMSKREASKPLYLTRYE